MQSPKAITDPVKWLQLHIFNGGEEARFCPLLISNTKMVQFASLLCRNKSFE